MIMESRLRLRKEITGDEPIYAEICQDEKEANRFSNDLEKRVIDGLNRRLGNSSGAAQALVAGLAIQSSVMSTYACDKTLFLSSSGKVCDTNDCTKLHMYSMPIQTGSTICFNTMDGDKIEMRIKDSKAVTRYHSAYYACSYKVITETRYECKKMNGACWNGGKCRKGYKHSAFSEEKVYPHAYGCISDTVGCDTWCWHQTSCTWFKWVMMPITEKCYKVYNKMSEIWQTSIFIKYKGITKHIKLNSNNPQYNLNGHDIKGLKNMPIVLTSFTYEQIHLRNAIVYTGRRFYEIEDASMPNFPVKNTIGEYQMSLDKQSYVAYTNELSCQMISCKGNCSYDEPAVDRLSLNDYNLIEVGKVSKMGDDVLKRKIPSTLACTACNEKPTAILKAYDIKTEGLIEYESNCSWTQLALSCNPEPYTITLEENSAKCLINIINTNQTLIVDFNYVFIGSLSLLKTYYAESAVEALESIATDKAFWGTLVSSLNFMAVLSVGSVAILKIVRLGITYKTNKDMSTV
ncbi:uncharacterized protein LOC123876046 [Maniola jurtina]|uniref:uncharacterized protein LOC123876046 n=1 Tax=Maniola jurtina TaxID=191418 RepID=UPI001E68FD45|nr:uncharacterized protein LOC123876046 [Maniola jurtina]